MRSAVKRTAERLLVTSGLTKLSRGWRRGEILVLAYHNVVPHDRVIRGERSLHLSQREFARQLDSLRESHEVVPLASILDLPTHSSRPRVAITFDDAYMGAVTVGVAELVKRRLPATIFVAPAYVDGGNFWWDRLADPQTGELHESIRSYALQRLGGQEEKIRRWAMDCQLPSQGIPDYQSVASEKQLSVAAAQPGITLASHTWSHANLSVIGEHLIEEELGRPIQWLRERFHATIPWLAYPYGLYSRTVEAVAQSVGYHGAFRVEGGWISPRVFSQKSALPRLNIAAGLSVEGFMLRTSGLFSR